MPYVRRPWGGALRLRRPWGAPYDVRGGALPPYGVRGGALRLRRPRGCLTLTAPVGAPQVEECRILFLFSGYSLSLSILKCLGVLVRYSFVIEVSNNIEQALSSNINKQLALPHNLRIVHIVRRQVYKVRSQRCSTAPACPNGLLYLTTFGLRKSFGAKLTKCDLNVAPRHLPAALLPQYIFTIHTVTYHLVH